MNDDDLPKKLKDMVIGENLDLLSVAELEQRLQALHSEISRITNEITKKHRSRSTADAFFTKKP